MSADDRPGRTTGGANGHTRKVLRASAGVAAAGTDSLTVTDQTTAFRYAVAVSVADEDIAPFIQALTDEIDACRDYLRLALERLAEMGIEREPVEPAAVEAYRAMVAYADRLDAARAALNEQAARVADRFGP